MNATELFHQDGKTAGIWHCGKCRIVKRTKEEAEACCAPPTCATCGRVDVRQYHTTCDACEEKKRADREARRFADAAKATQWNGAVYSDGLGSNEGYFRNLEELEDYLACEAEDDGSQPDRPEYVWTCDERQFCQLNYSRIIEDVTQDAYEDWDGDSVNGEEVLKAAIEAFNALNTEHIVWEPNYKLALLLPKNP